MDVSTLLWDFVFAVSHLCHDELMKSEVYMRMECAALLNRKFIMDETSLVNVSLVTMFPRGSRYNQYDNTYEFEGMHALLFGALELLKTSMALDENLDAQEKLERLEYAVKRVDQHILVADICKRVHMHKLV
jgi:hypothetical protein